jgi:phage tail sheath gpL-like
MGSLSYPITGVPSTFKVPGGYAEILFAQGPATSSGGRRSVIFVMPMLSTGAWTVNTVYRVKSEKDAKDGAGVGSPLHIAVREFLMSNRTAECWALPYAETSGGAPAAATAVLTLVNSATGTGVLNVWIDGEQCSASFVNGDSITAIGDAIVASINGKEHLPVTAANGAGTITITARLKGKSQGDGTTGAISCHSEITTGIATTATLSGQHVGLGAGVDGAEGTTTEAANLATALAVIASARYYHIVTSTWHATELGNLKTHIASKSEPRPGLRSVGHAAYLGTLANGQTLATTLNYERIIVGWQKDGDRCPAAVAGQMAAVIQKRQEVDAAYNFDDYRGADWRVPAAYDQADWPDSDDLNDAITDGLTPIASDQSGSRIVYLATTRSKNAAGTVDDPRALEAHRISAADLVVDRMLNRYALQFGAKKLKADELLSDGSVNTNQALPRNTVTPSTFKPWIKDELNRAGDDGLLQEVEASKEGLAVIKDPANAGRLQVGVDFHVVDLLHQMTLRVAEVSTG